MNNEEALLEAIEKTPKAIEFEVNNDFVKKLPEIISNVMEIEKWAYAQTESDRNLVLVTDEDFDNAKKRCADINKVVSSIDDKRKAVKKAYSEPIVEFEKALKRVTTVLTEAKDNLWSQVINAENEAKQKKWNEINDYYDKTAGEFAEYKPFDVVADKTWANKTKSLISIYREIDEIIEKGKKDIESIKSIGDEADIPALMLKYKAGATLNEIITYANELKAIRNKDSNTISANTDDTPNNDKPVEEAPVKSAEIENEEKVEIVFKVTATPTQFKMLREFLMTNGIKYGKA